MQSSEENKMSELNDEWFAKYGFTDLTPEELEELKVLFMDELEMRIGNRLSEKMSKKQMQAFEAAEDDDKKLLFLEKTLPDYKETVYKEFDTIGKEIKKLGNKQAVLTAFRK